MRGNAIDDDETALMRSAIEKLQSAGRRGRRTEIALEQSVSDFLACGFVQMHFSDALHGAGYPVGVTSRQ